jgi:hypothetical protein
MTSKSLREKVLSRREWRDFIRKTLKKIYPNKTSIEILGYIGENFGIELAPVDLQIKKVFKYIKKWLEIYPEGQTIPFGYFYDEFPFMELTPNNYFKRRLSKHCKENNVIIRFDYKNGAVSFKYDKPI